jgi:hypothetical protein
MVRGAHEPRNGSKACCGPHVETEARVSAVRSRGSELLGRSSRQSQHCQAAHQWTWAEGWGRGGWEIRSRVGGLRGDLEKSVWAVPLRVRVTRVSLRGCACVGAS